MCIKGVIFDFNGTLFFDSHYHEEAWKTIAKEVFHHELTKEEIQHHLHGRNNDKIIQYLAQTEMTDQQCQSISQRKEAWYRQTCLAHKETTTLVAGAETFFAYLQNKQIPFTIASASIKENIDFFVEIFDLRKWIDPSTITYDNGVYQDKVAMFQDAAKNIGVPIEECLVFEDSFSGIAFAKQANAKAIVAIDKTNDPQKYASFPYLLGHAKDFIDMDKKLQDWYKKK